MAHITGTDRAQVLLLPDTVDDYVGPDNPVRFIDAFVDSLDLAGAGFERAEPKETGRPGYDPSDLLKLYIYGYLNRVQSSRRLEAETHRNLKALWLLRRSGLQHPPCDNLGRDPGTDRRVGRSNQLESPPQGPVATHQGAWHQRIDDNPLTAQIPGLSHRKIRLGPTFHTVSNVYATIRPQTGFQGLGRC